MFSHRGHQHALDIIHGMEASIQGTIAMQLQAARPPPPEPEPDTSNLSHPDGYEPPAPSRKERDEQAAAYRRGVTNAQKEHNARIAAKNKELRETKGAKTTHPYIKKWKKQDFEKP